MTLRELFGKPSSPISELKKLFGKYEDVIDGPTSLQYEAVGGYLGLRSQGVRDGWMNWSGWHEETIEILKTYLPQGAGRAASRIRKDLDAILEAGQTGADEGRFAYEELDRLAPDVIAWCKRNRKLIQLPEGVDSWIETVGNSKD